MDDARLRDVLGARKGAVHLLTTSVVVDPAAGRDDRDALHRPVP